MKPISRGVLYFFAFLMVLAAQLSFPKLLIGQFTTASLSGTVVDPSGEAIPGAKVTVQNTDTGFTQSVAAGPTGDTSSLACRSEIIS
jgi:Carboxypeptidase regulatory-like domain